MCSASSAAIGRATRRAASLSAPTTSRLRRGRDANVGADADDNQEEVAEDIAQTAQRWSDQDAAGYPTRSDYVMNAIGGEFDNTLTPCTS